MLLVCKHEKQLKQMHAFLPKLLTEKAIMTVIDVVAKAPPSES